MRAELRYPGTLDNTDRRFIHKLAGQLGLFSKSYGSKCVSRRCPSRRHARAPPPRFRRSHKHPHPATVPLRRGDTRKKEGARYITIRRLKKVNPDAAAAKASRRDPVVAVQPQTQAYVSVRCVLQSLAAIVLLAGCAAVSGAVFTVTVPWFGRTCSARSRRRWRTRSLWRRTWHGVGQAGLWEAGGTPLPGPTRSQLSSRRRTTRLPPRATRSQSMRRCCGGYASQGALHVAVRGAVGSVVDHGFALLLLCRLLLRCSANNCPRGTLRRRLQTPWPTTKSPSCRATRGAASPRRCPSSCWTTRAWAPRPPSWSRSHAASAPSAWPSGTRLLTGRPARPSPPSLSHHRRPGCLCEQCRG